MNEETSPTADPKDSLVLKLVEPEVSERIPWKDDVLGRAQIAVRLTNLISNQSLPLTISIHGAWGTGKTFMLKRWQKDLESQKFRAIYFNAWEDDFCDDPLLAIVGQLEAHFEMDHGSKVKKIVDAVTENAGPLFKANVVSLLEKHTGFTLNLGPLKLCNRSPIKEYLKQATIKDELKEQLAELAAAVYKESGQPLVFIID